MNYSDDKEKTKEFNKLKLQVFLNRGCPVSSINIEK